MASLPVVASLPGVFLAVELLPSAVLTLSGCDGVLDLEMGESLLSFLEDLSSGVENFILLLSTGTW